MEQESLYPAYAGLSESRSSLEFLESPSGFDYFAMVTELMKHQSLLNNTDVFSMSAVITPAGADVAEVAISALGYDGELVAGGHLFEVWLSDDADGVGLTATTASGTVTAKAASGAVIGTHTAKKALLVQSLSTGIFTLEITDDANTAFKVCVRCPGTGKTIVVATLAAESYGS